MINTKPRDRLVQLINQYKADLTDEWVAVGNTDSATIKIVLSDNVRTVRALVHKIAP